MSLSIYQQRWRFVPSLRSVTEPNHDLAAYGIILTDGKWGSENTPVCVVAEIHKDVAAHVIDLHNASFANPRPQQE